MCEEIRPLSCPHIPQRLSEVQVKGYRYGDGIWHFYFQESDSNSGVCVCVFWSVCCGGWVFVCVSKVCPVPAAEINCKLEALSLGIILHTWQSLLRQSERGEAGVRTRWAVQSWCSLSALHWSEIDGLCHLPPVTPTVWVQHDITELYV